MKRNITNTFSFSNQTNTPINCLDTEDQSLYDYLNFIHIPNIIKGDRSTVIGHGTCSEVFLVENIVNRKHYINKVYDFSIFPKLRRSVEKELFYFRKFSHENIIKVYSQHSNRDKLKVILDYGSKGTLASFVAQTGRLDETNSFVYFYQILNGLSYIHSHKLIARNLQPENILITGDDRILISDLTMCRKINKKKLLLYEQYEDVWSLGVILYLLTQGVKEIREHNNITKKCKFPTQISYDCQHLIETLLNADSNTSIKDIYDHPWIQSYLNGPNKVDLHKFKESTKEKVFNLNNNIQSGMIEFNILTESSEDMSPISKINHNKNNSKYQNQDISYEEQYVETCTSSRFNCLVGNMNKENVDGFKTKLSSRSVQSSLNGINLLIEAKKANDFKSIPVVQKPNFWDKFTDYFAKGCK